MSQELTEVQHKPETHQRKTLGKREMGIGRFQETIEELLISMPLDFAQTEAGEKLMAALAEAEDSLTSSRIMIRREIAPSEKKK